MGRTLLVLTSLAGACSSPSGALIITSWPGSFPVDALAVETSVGGQAPMGEVLAPPEGATTMTSPYRVLVHSPANQPLLVRITALAGTRTVAAGRMGVTPRSNEIVQTALELQSALTCGDGVLDTGEECDDGNREDRDSCTNDCACPRCGDGVLYSFATPRSPGCPMAEVEECDDGNQVAGDGCSATCEREP
jgi:cysteine-rich repeat protein